VLFAKHQRTITNKKWLPFSIDDPLNMYSNLEEEEKMIME